jgi:protein-S-isoprenylcysteine O-methyltransferase Ste14
MPDFLESMHLKPRRAITVAWGLLFIGVVFGWLPFYAAERNADLNWPRWDVPGGRIAGVGLFAGGLALSLYCSRMFARIGKGTPVPFDPPKELVVSGLYRYTRNPIYVAQVAILLSYFLYFGHLALLAHAGAWALLVQAWVVWVEEPGLRRRFGKSYARYAQEVPRWFAIRPHSRKRTV